MTSVILLDRRGFLHALLFALPSVAGAQTVSKPYRIGYLGNAPVERPVSEAFATAMRDRGWIEGQNYTMDWRWSEGRNERLPGLGAELVGRKSTLIIAEGTAAAAAAKAATATIPIVFWSVGDAVGSGLVVSLARPGKNATGLSGFGPGSHAKMLQLLKEAVPRASRVGMLVNPTFPLHRSYRQEVESAAANLSVVLRPHDAQNPEDIDAAFAAMARENVDAVVILGQPIMFALRARVAKLALDHRMPSIITWHEAAEAGVLMSYGDRKVDQVRRVPPYVDRILKGAKPGDLPVEQTTIFHFAVNLRTAKLLGLTIPPSLLLRADQVIQ